MFNIAFQDIENKDTLLLGISENLPVVNDIFRMNNYTYIVEDIASPVRDGKDDGLYIISIKKVSIQ